MFAFSFPLMAQQDVYRILLQGVFLSPFVSLSLLRAAPDLFVFEFIMPSFRARRLIFVFQYGSSPMWLNSPLSFEEKPASFFYNLSLLCTFQKFWE